MPRSAAAHPSSRRGRSPLTRPRTGSSCSSAQTTVLTEVGLFTVAPRLLQVRWAVLGAGRPDITTAVEGSWRPRPRGAGWPHTVADDEPPGPGEGTALRGLFCGGTLADRGDDAVQAELGGIRSGIAHSADLPGSAQATCTTRGTWCSTSATTGSPAADTVKSTPPCRLERMAAEAVDPTCGVLLLDLVLGHGAHPDLPASWRMPFARLAASPTPAGGPSRSWCRSPGRTPTPGPLAVRRRARRRWRLGVPVEQRGGEACARPARSPA